jgi:hypothetical protein
MEGAHLRYRLITSVDITSGLPVIRPRGNLWRVHTCARKDMEQHPATKNP